MKYFTAWFNPSVEKYYIDYIDKTKKVIPDLEIWTSVPKDYPWKETSFYVSNKFRIWMLANYYNDGGIWIDADVVVKKKFEVPEKTIMIPYMWDGEPIKGMNLPKKITSGTDLKMVHDFWAIGHNKRPEFFKEIINLALSGKIDFRSLKDREPPGLSEFHKHMYEILNEHREILNYFYMHTNEWESFPLGLFKHSSLFSQQTVIIEDDLSK
jgi:hypothetical protein